jgi:hypothetical protein
VRYLGRDRARDNDCYGDGFAVVAVTTEADEVRLAAGCEHSGYLNRYRQEGGAFRRILASLRPPDTREE